MHSVNAEVGEQIGVKEGTSKRAQREGEHGMRCRTQVCGNAIIKPTIYTLTLKSKSISAVRAEDADTCLLGTGLECATSDSLRSNIPRTILSE